MAWRILGAPNWPTAERDRDKQNKAEKPCTAENKTIKISVIAHNIVDEHCIAREAPAAAMRVLTDSFASKAELLILHSLLSHFVHLASNKLYPELSVHAVCYVNWS